MANIKFYGILNFLRNVRDSSYFANHDLEKIHLLFDVFYS